MSIRPVVRYATPATVIIQVCFTLAVLASLPLSRHFWIADLANFIRQHLLLVSAGLLIIGMVLPGRATKIGGLAAFSAACVPWLQLPAPAAPAAGTAFTLVTANVDVHNPDPRPFLAIPDIAAADVLVLQEVRDRWQDAVIASGIWPFASGRDLPANTDMKVFSRFPILHASTVVPDGSDTGGRHAMRLELLIGNRSVILYAVHPQSPRSSGMWAERGAYLRDLKSALTSEPAETPVIVAGDWNTPPWSPAFQGLMESTGYRSTESRWWPPPTRFSLRLPALLGTPIDRIVISSHLGMDELVVGPKFGSGHLPMIAKLTLAEGTDR